jgi:hypothetical protein
MPQTHPAISRFPANPFGKLDGEQAKSFAIKTP